MALNCLPSKQLMKKSFSAVIEHGSPRRFSMIDVIKSFLSPADLPKLVKPLQVIFVAPVVLPSHRFPSRSSTGVPPPDC